MTNYQFNIITYTNEFEFIVATKKQVNIRRASVNSATDFIKGKYKSRDGFFVELNKSWSV